MHRLLLTSAGLLGLIAAPALALAASPGVPVATPMAGQSANPANGGGSTGAYSDTGGSVTVGFSARNGTQAAPPAMPAGGEPVTTWRSPYREDRATSGGRAPYGVDPTTWQEIMSAGGAG